MGSALGKIEIPEWTELSLPCVGGRMLSVHPPWCAGREIPFEAYQANPHDIRMLSVETGICLFFLRKTESRHGRLYQFSRTEIRSRTRDFPNPQGCGCRLCPGKYNCCYHRVRGISILSCKTSCDNQVCRTKVGTSGAPWKKWAADFKALGRSSQKK